MGKTKQATRIISDVAIDTKTATSIGESMVGAGFDYVEDEAQKGNITINSPVMKKLDAVQTVSAAQEATDEEVKQSHEEVGLDISSHKYKRKKNVEEANKKLKLLGDKNANGTGDTLYDKRKAFNDKEIKKVENMNYVMLLSASMNLPMADPDTSGAESLVKNYEEIQKVFMYLPDIKDYVDKQLATLSGQNITAEEREKVFRLQARYKTLCDIKAYYDTTEAMMKNKYYVHLPESEMKKLSYEELMRRLDELYKADQRNQELIDYYQNLVRLKMLSIEDHESVLEREKKYFEEANPVEEEDKRDAAEEMEKMADAYDNLMKFISGKKLLPEGTKDTYIKKFFDTARRDIQKFRRADGVKENKKLFALMEGYQKYLQANFPGKTFGTPPGDNDEPETFPADTLHFSVQGINPEEQKMIVRNAVSESGIVLGNEQKKSLTQASRYLFESGIKRGRIPFVNNLLQAPPDQQLIFFYLAEKGMDDIVVDAGFFTAIKNYKPDPERFVNFHGDKNWDLLSRAVRKSMDFLPQLKYYHELDQNIAKFDRQIDSDSKNEDQTRTDEDKIKTIVDAISERGKLLKMLYRNAGLHDDMPPDMVEDRALRQKLMTEYVKTVLLIKKLSDLKPQNQPQAGYTGGKVRENKADLKEVPEGTDHLERAEKVFDKTGEFFVDDVLGNIDNVFGTFKSIYDLDIDSTFGALSSWVTGAVGGLAALIGSAGVVLSTINLIRGAAPMSAADTTAQSFSIIGSAVGVGGSMFSSAAGFTELASVGTATVTGLSATGGALLGVAGGIKMVSSGIQGARAFSSISDINTAGRKLEEIKKERAAQNQATAQQQATVQQQATAQQTAETGLTKDEMAVQRFLKHEKRESERRAVSAAEGVAAGFFLGASAVLLGTGNPICMAVGAGVALTTIVIDIGFKVANKYAKYKIREAAVNDFLHLDEMVKAVKQGAAPGSDLANAKDGDIRDMVREEALAMYGFSSSKECYRHICMQFAETLYTNVFDTQGLSQNEQDFYLNAIKSLGLKFDKDKRMPTVEQMFTSLMSQ